MSRCGNLTALYLCLALTEYETISEKTLQESIEKEMSGELMELLVAIGRLMCLSMWWTGL